METFEIIVSVILGVYVPGSLAWAWSMNQKISDNRLEISEVRLEISEVEGDLKVNTSRDETIWAHLAKMEAGIEEIKKEIGWLREAIAAGLANHKKS